MKLMLAPMAGVTDWPFRLLCYEQGCDMHVTEMISAQGYITAKATTTAYINLTASSKDEGQLIAQIFGHEPIYMAQAASRLTQTGQFVGIDINMGCPAHKVVGSGSGSALMKDEILVGEIVREVKKSTLLPVSVKMRLGWDESSINAVKIAQIVQEEGASFITVHGRTRTQQYQGKANIDEIAKVKQAVSIPLYANGDVVDVKSALEMVRITACDGLAIGRGAMGNPFIFAQLKACFDGKSPVMPTTSEIVATARRHAEMMQAWKGERSALLEMRKHIAWYIRGQKGASVLRGRVNTAETFDEMYALLDAFQTNIVE